MEPPAQSTGSSPYGPANERASKLWRTCSENAAVEGGEADDPHVTLAAELQCAVVVHGLRVGRTWGQAAHSHTLQTHQRDIRLGVRLASLSFPSLCCVMSG
jgi:hypothetical protein